MKPSKSKNIYAVKIRYIPWCSITFLWHTAEINISVISVFCVTYT